MSKIVLIALSLLVPIFSAHAFDASIKGFIALDMLSIKKQESRKQEVETGIGTLDLKVYATQDDFTAKLKLDLDDSRIGDAGNIFEEATVSYKFLPDHQLIMGKGKVPFHQMHWGVINSSYTDGGAIFNTDHSIRDFDNRLVLTWRYGGFTRGFFNYLTYWGNSEQAQKNSNGTLRTSGSAPNLSLVTQNNKTFSSKDEAGVANKFEWFFNRQLSASMAAIYYYNDINPKNSWAFDLATRYSSRDVEVWAEMVRGFTSTNPYARYATLKKNESLFQIGAEYYLTELYNALANIEAVLVNNQHHEVTGSTFNDGKRVKTNTYKVEAGVKVKFQKSAFMTLGAQAERQDEEVPADNTDTSQFAYQLAAKISFWF